MRKELLRIIAIVLVVFSANMAMAQTYTYPAKGKDGFTLTQKRMDGVSINYNMSQFTLNSLNYRGEEMSEISMNAIPLPNVAGCPNLPADSRLMAIPQGAKATLEVVSCETQIIEGVNIAPALRIQAESEEPDMNYVKDMKVYAKDAFYPENPFVIGSSYIRGVDAATVAVTPFQYNPVTKQLKVYTNVKLEVKFEGGNGHFGDNRLRSPYWDNILATELINYDQLPVIDYAARMQQWLRDGEEGAEYIIVTPNNDAWAEYANQLKDYRTRQGIITKVYRLDEMPANSINELKEWFHNAYSSWEIAPVAVCLLGDHGTNMAQYIPAETVPHPYEGTCITDNRYADVNGDNLPDMVFSRLIAQSASELPVFVGKQIEYEYTNVNMDPSFYERPITALGWQTERWFQLCSEVFGGYMRSKGYNTNRINCIYDGTPGTIWSSAQNTNSVVNYFGPAGQGYIPQAPNELGDWNNGSPEMVVNAVNEGTFWLQHRDHGLETGWGEPAVRNNHVAQCNNVNKLPFVMSINCLTGKFNYSSDCFAEAWMRRTYNGQNAGAVGVLCPTETSYSFVNDAFVWGVYDLFDSEFMPDYGPYADKSNNWMPAFGNVAGKYFLYQSSWPYNSQDKDITYTMFTAHCDAFLRIYTQVPQTMDVSHQEVVIAGLGEMTVSAPEGCIISLVTENAEGGWNILAVEEATGDQQTIQFEAQVPPTIINLVITGQNYLRYEDEITVVPADGPYIVFSDKVIHDEDGNGQLDFGEAINLDVTLKNVGSDPMDDFSAVLETESEYINITNGTANYNSISPNETQTIENAFSFTVADNVPDNTSNAFTITVNNGDENYVSRISMKAFAPVFKIGNMTIHETNGNGNGRLDAGEDAELTFSFENKGHSNAINGLTSLNLLSPYIDIEENEVPFEVLAAGQTLSVTYSIHISDETPIGYICNATLDVEAGQYNSTQDFVVKVGVIVEDFESGELGEGWVNNGNNSWYFVNEDPYEGQYCLRSGAIGGNGSINLSLTHEAGANDTIAFYYKVSSEANYDKMYFYIDGQEKDNWSGEVAWTRAAYPVSQGTHTYKWTYKKDISVSGGQDCCWIDFVSLPAARVMAGTAGKDVTVCEGNDAQIIGYAANYDNLLWTSAGDGTFNDATIETPIYTPGTNDIANGSVVLTITINGNGETITDDMTVSFYEGVEIEDALVDYYYCAVSKPQEIGVTISGDYASFVWSTSGDGTFENATELMTTYTPGPQDIENGVTLTATAQSEGCGPKDFIYPFEMNPMPELTLNGESIEICEGENAIMNFNMTGSAGTWGAQPEFSLTLNGTTYDAHSGANTLDLGVLEAGTHEFNISWVSNIYCTTDYEAGERTFTVNVINSNHLSIEGETELDANITRTSTYTVTDDIMVNWNIEPAEAGTLTPSNNGNGVTVTWAEQFKGEVILTATPTMCEVGGTQFHVNVKNSSDVNENSIVANIFPNPTNGNITIQAAQMQRITVVNALGQVMLDNEVDSDSETLDMSQFGTGVYVVRIVTSNGTILKNVNVM
ncbi:MAG: C25 family cysteine peptidase [Bacteroidales bacterium]|nr:C25 family cysteine peptidase [Bacteroidales bacterium]